MKLNVQNKIEFALLKQYVGRFNNETIYKQIMSFGCESCQITMVWIDWDESATAIPQIEVILNHVLKGCSLRAQVSWIIPTQISIALSISSHSLCPSLTSPLPLCLTGKLPSYWSPRPNLQKPTPSSGPGVRAVTKPVGKGKEDTPHWVQLGFEKVKHFSSTKF